MQDINYNECKQRGTTNFPIDYHYVDSTHPQYDMPLHWHIEYEIIRIISGTFIIFLDGQKHIAKKGDICFIKDGVLHRVAPQNCIYECLVFDINMLRNRNYTSDSFIRKISHHKLLVNCLFKNDFENLDSTLNTQLFYFASCLFEAQKNRTPGFELITVGTLQMFFGVVEQEKYYSLDVTSSIREHKRTEQLKLAFELIATSYDTPLTLENLSKSANMSPKYFCRFFRDMTHRSPIDYLNYYRIEKACHQISTGEFSLIDIAYNCGFNDFSYFIKTFKKYKATTPKKYSYAEL